MRPTEMRSRWYWWPAALVIVLAIGSGLGTLWTGNRPLLGLDLQGGVSVVLQPTAPADDEALQQTLSIIRSRVDSLGVAEPEIALQGDTIVVDLPGVEEQQRAVDLVGQTAELRFRPVIFNLGPETPPGTEGTGDTTPGETIPGETVPGDTTPEDTTPGETGSGDDPTGSIPADTLPTTTVPPAGDGSATNGGDEQGMGTLTPIAFTQDTGTAQPDTTDSIPADTLPTEDTVPSDTAPSETVPSDTVPSETVPSDTVPADGSDPSVLPLDQQTLDAGMADALAACSTGQLTTPEGDVADAPVLLMDRDGNRLCLGPTLLTGDALETADVGIVGIGSWTVNPVFKEGPTGIDAFNAAAAKCYVSSPDQAVCPSGQLAIVLDHEVVSAPTINSSSFSRDQIEITGNFDEAEARDIASVLRFGALPVELETLQTRTVSATIGSDALRAGVIAGLFGLALVMIYLLAYYKLAGLVAIGGLALSGVMLWAIIAWFGSNQGLALTMAGVVGLIASIGVAADSNIVYFENVKDAYLTGRRPPTAVDRAYGSSISTIVKADVVSLIAAGLLYWLTVGAVRGFAFYLGLATLLDLFIAWLFMRPALMVLARRGAVRARPRLLGLPARSDEPDGGPS
ncbi:MAG: protein translocase subunit SecD [Acidimicrobiales bacterium]